MAICKPAEIKGKLTRGEALLGLDVGAKTIGLAISDIGFMVASPLITIARKKFAADWLALERVITERHVGGLVIGLPIEMSGAEGSRAQSVRSFVSEVLKRRELPVTFWDERLSTAAVERMLTNEADLSRKRRSELVDKAAAAYILQSMLDAVRSA